MTDRPILAVDADRITITGIETPCPTCKGTKVVTRGGYYFDCGECRANAFPRDPTGFITRRSAVIVVDGEPVEYDGLDNAWVNGQRRPDLDHTGPESRKVRVVPPEQVRRLTEPCRTCGGAMFTLGWRPSGCNSTEVEEPCSDCLKGRQTFTLHQRCDADEHWCEGSSGIYGDDHGPLVCETGCAHCGCNGDGFIDLGDGWVITDVQPISKPYGLAYTGKPYISINDEGAAIIGQRESVGPVPITLPPAARPDMLAVFAERESPDE